MVSLLLKFRLKCDLKFNFFTFIKASNIANFEEGIMIVNKMEIVQGHLGDSVG